MTEVPREISPKVLTLDDIRAGLSELAINGEGAQRTQAYRILMSMSGGESALPDPLATGDIVKRMERLMRGAGIKLTRAAMIRAFPQRHSARNVQRELVIDEELQIGDVNKFPRTIKAFYKRYPEIRANGFPKGWPLKGSLVDKKEFLIRESLKIERSRVAAKKAEATLELQEVKDASKTPDGPPGGS